MSGNRVVYQNWIVELGRDPETSAAPSGEEWSDARLFPLDHPAVANLTSADGRPTGDEPRESIRRRVGAALDELDDDERELVIQFHFMGESYRRISEKSGRSIHKLEAMHKRSLRKLRKNLAEFVGETFGVSPRSAPDCPVCRSPHAAELDEIIRRRDRTATWRPILSLFRTRYKLYIGSPQVLIGHEKYH